jgi:hypothetical protein
VYGVQLTEDNGYHTAAAATETADGAVHLAWIQYVPAGAIPSSQEDDEMAWSSPMWVTPKGTESAKR